VRDPSEDELDGWMACLAAGEREAFDPLFRALHPRALRLARLKLSEDGAAEAAQTILMQLFARASEFEAGRPMLPWFYAVAANEIQRLKRQAVAASQRAAVPDAEPAAVAESNPERQLLDRELHESLERAIAALDRESAEAIASMLGDVARPAIAPAAFRKRVSRAYAELRRFFGGDRGE